MAKRGLDRGQIIEQAIALVEKNGYDKFSLRELAVVLNVKPASLYNHIAGIEEIYREIALGAALMMKSALGTATEGKALDKAFEAGVRAYRQFAMEHPELYQAFVQMPSLHDEAVTRASYESFLPLRNIIEGYGLSDPELMHFARSLRSVMHGFIELTKNGFMQRGEITREETYEEIIAEYLLILKKKSQAKEELSL